MARRRRRGRHGLAGSVTRVEKCLKCGKLVRSDQMDAHIAEHLDKTRGEPHEQGVSRIMRIFAELEHLQEHGDPDCPQCKRIRDTTQTFTIIPVRYKYVSLKSGAVTILGTRQKPFNENAWVYTVMLAQPNEVDELVGSFDTRKNKQRNGYYFSWWHNEGPGYDEGGNNRAAYLLERLLQDGTISPYDIEGTRDMPLYRAKSSDDIEDEP